MKFLVVFIVSFAANASALLVVRNRSAIHSTHNSTSDAVTFDAWYATYTTGRGIWKWDQALFAYQRHFAHFTGGPVSLLEVGVQSGGSIDMYKAVLGSGCHYYGIDINTNCEKYSDATTTIAILDQGDSSQWNHFFAHVKDHVDILIDDGGHQAFQMTTTLKAAFPNINPGGVHLIEDIHGTNEDYMTGMFNPAADFLGFQFDVASIHIYPFVLVVQKAGGSYTPPAAWKVTPAATYGDITQMMNSLPHHGGQIVELSNPSWGSFHTADSLKALFETFYDMHQGTVATVPEGCFNDAVKYPHCTMKVANSYLQSYITAVDIFPSFAHVHVAKQPPSIFATRKGTVWIPYSD